MGIGIFSGSLERKPVKISNRYKRSRNQTLEDVVLGASCPTLGAFWGVVSIVIFGGDAKCETTVPNKLNDVCPKSAAGGCTCDSDVTWAAIR